MKKVILLGYMGAGKTVTARALSEVTGLHSLDLDTEIEKKEQLPVSKIFAQKGEIGFRRSEHETLKDLLASDDRMILSLGGGTPCYSGNHLLLTGPGIQSFYLQASVKTLSQRLESEKSQRPLLSAIATGDLEKFIGQHLFERSNYYATADFTIHVDGKSPLEIASEIYQKLL